MRTIFPVVRKTFICSPPSENFSISSFQSISSSGATIGDGDRNCATFLVLGLSLWYGKIFLFLNLEQICVPVAHSRTSWEDFCGCRAVEIASKFPKYFMLLAHNSTR